MDEEELLFGDVEVREETDEFAVNSILVTVEQFLLPTNTDASEDDIQKSKNLLLKKNFPDIDMSLSPRSRLDQICFQVTLADHIRTMQIMYKDTTDELQLAKHLRQDAVTLPTKHLQEKIAEGQARIIALCRLCYGDHSLEMLRATVDLASSYAQQGMWTQVSEHLSSCAEKMSKMLQSGKHSKRMVVSRCAAARVQCVYRILRQHAVNNCGQVNAKTFLRELISELNTLPEVDHSDDDSTLSYSTKLAALMHDFFSKFSINQHKYPQAKVIPKLIIVRENQTAADFTAGAPGPPKLVRRTPSWGDVIDYLRRDCAIMKDWMTSTEDALLPQQRAAVALAFRCADPLGKGVAHPAQLSSLMAEFPCCTRVVAGTPAAKQLQHMATEVSLLFDNAVGEVVDVASAKARRHREGNIFLTRDDSDHDNGPDTTQTVVYELPVTWEEVLSSIVLETYTDPLQLQQTQLLVLQGVHEIFSGNLSQSEEHLREGLRVFEEMGMEMEVVACELYNSIAQMMVIKYRQAEERKKQRVRKAATQWFLTEAGRKELRDKMKEIRTKFMMRQIQISPAEAEIRARNILYKAKVADIRVYMERSGTETSTKTIEAASRYLIRSHEILESAHGSAHPCVSTACLAVASVQNLAGKLENAREWLVLAMRCMLKCDPTPVRALAFAQIQLSQVLSKHGHIDETINVLSKAAEFHVDRAMEAMERLRKGEESVELLAMGPIGPMLKKVFVKGKQPYEDVNLAIELSSRLARLCSQSGDKGEACEYAVLVARLTEMAYGWDSAEVAEARKEAGQRCVTAGDWPRALSNLKASVESTEFVYGKADPHYIEILKLFQKATDGREHLLGGEDGAGAGAGGGRTGRGRSGSRSPKRGHRSGQSKSPGPGRSEGAGGLSQARGLSAGQWLEAMAEMGQPLVEIVHEQNRAQAHLDLEGL